VSAADAVQRWAEYMKGKAQRKPYPVHQMSPWEENAWFQTPVQTDTTIPGSTVLQILKADPQRVGIIFGTPQAPADLIVSINNAASGTSGFQIQNTTLPWVLLQAQVGPLVAMEWFANNPSAGPLILSVIEIKLRSWP
jgi:hypothetical protein